MTKTTFAVDYFKPTQWATAEDKAVFCNKFAAFVEHDFKESMWTKMVYTGVYQHLGFIAHYNIHGFYDEYFRTGQHRCRFLRELVEQQYIGDWKDVQDVLSHWLLNSGQAERIGNKARDESRATRLAIYRELKAEFDGQEPPAPSAVQAALF